MKANKTARAVKRDMPEYPKPMLVLCSSRLGGAVNAEFGRRLTGLKKASFDQYGTEIESDAGFNRAR